MRNKIIVLITSSFLSILILRSQVPSTSLRIDEFLMTVDMGDDSLLSVYSWIVNNVSYDFESFYSGEYQPELEARIAYILKNKKGVCQHYADLLVESARRIGYESYLIGGCSLLDYESMDFERSSHAWVAIKLDDRWSYFDPTWDTPDIRSNSTITSTEFNFYGLSVEEMNKTHKAFLRFWSDSNISESERSIKINEFHSFDEYQRTQILIEDLKQEQSECGRSAYEYHLSLLENLEFNKAIDTYNGALSLFIRYKEDKQGFFKKRSDEYLSELMKDIVNKTEAVRTTLNKKEMRILARSIENDIYEIFIDFEEHVNDEHQFLNSYLAKGKLGRSMLLLNSSR